MGVSSRIPVIGTGSLSNEVLVGQVAVVTGAGRGIGFEAARSLVWLGARVVIAEIDRLNGSAAATRINAEFGPERASFLQTDISDERAVDRLAKFIFRSYGRADIVLNNATITPMGAAKDVLAKEWDASYGVNLRGPVLLARAFLPGMLSRDYGVFACVSSVGQAFMGAYECFKAAQVHLAETLDAELEGTGVHAFAIGPGLVHTPGAEAGIAELAPLYGKSIEEFYALSREHIISAEAAGAGFAAAIALAPRFRGQDTNAKAALIAAGIEIPEESLASAAPALSMEQTAEALARCRSIRSTLQEQYDGWVARPLFERQWMLRDFRKHAGRSPEDWLADLARLEETLNGNDRAGASALRLPVGDIARYAAHYSEMAAGYLKDAAQRQEVLGQFEKWRQEAARLGEILR